MSSMFRSLANPNYRIWFAGALVSNVGAWMQATTQNWVVLTELSDGNAIMVGTTMALQFGPQLLLVPFSGAVADRFDRRKVLLTTQSLLMLLALGLGLLLLSGHAQIWHVLGFAGMLGIVNAFDTPARQAFVSDLVGRAQLSNAVALNSASFNSARLVGPAVAGVLIAAVGSGWVFVINAASFLGVLVALMLITTKPPKRPEADERRESQLTQLAAGFRYVWRRHDLRVIFVMVFFVGAFGMNFPVVSTTMAVEFGRGAGEYGLLSSVLAIGSLGGALLVARRPAARMRAVILAAGGFGLASMLAAVMPTFWTFAAVLILMGYCTATFLTTANGFVQTTTDAGVRGRVLSLYFAILMGGTPIGAPVTGWVADTLGPRWTLAVGALAGLLACAIGVTWLFTERRLRFHLGPRLHVGVTHAGRPGLDDDHAEQVETLTAPLSVLRRETGPVAAPDSAPQDVAAGEPFTGRIDLGKLDELDGERGEPGAPAGPGEPEAPGASRAPEGPGASREGDGGPGVDDDPDEPGPRPR